MHILECTYAYTETDWNRSIYLSIVYLWKSTGVSSAFQSQHSSLEGTEVCRRLSRETEEDIERRELEKITKADERMNG